MIPALGMVILPQNPITENGHVPGWSCILSVDSTRVARILCVCVVHNALPYSHTSFPPPLGTEKLSSMSAEAAAPPAVPATWCSAFGESATFFSLAMLPVRRFLSSGAGFET